MCVVCVYTCIGLPPGCPLVIQSVPTMIGSNIPQETSGVPLVIWPVPMMIGSNIPQETSGVPSVIWPVPTIIGSNIPQETSGVPSVIWPVPMMICSNIPQNTSGVPSVIGSNISTSQQDIKSSISKSAISYGVPAMTFTYLKGRTHRDILFSPLETFSKAHPHVNCLNIPISYVSPYMPQIPFHLQFFIMHFVFAHFKTLYNFVHACILTKTKCTKYLNVYLWENKINLVSWCLFDTWFPWAISAVYFFP